MGGTLNYRMSIQNYRTATILAAKKTSVCRILVLGRKHAERSELFALPKWLLAVAFSRTSEDKTRSAEQVGAVVYHPQ